MKRIAAMSTGQQVEQGDLCIAKIGERDTPYEPVTIIEDGVLARGEVTGHVHRVMASLEELYTPEDLRFFEEQQRKLDAPVCFRDKDTVRQEITIQGKRVVRDVVAKIHAPSPFFLVHHSEGHRVVLADDLDALRTQGHHEPIQFPAGLYQVTRQTEYYHVPRPVAD